MFLSAKLSKISRIPKLNCCKYSKIPNFEYLFYSKIPKCQNRRFRSKYWESGDFFIDSFSMSLSESN